MLAIAETSRAPRIASNPSAPRDCKRVRRQPIGSTCYRLKKSMDNTYCKVGCVRALTLFALIAVAHADSNKDYIQKEFYGHLVRLPTLPGLAPSCEDTMLGGRMAQTVPRTHVLVTCASDRDKWNETMNLLTR
jgi:hypothetical protein